MSLQPYDWLPEHLMVFGMFCLPAPPGDRKPPLSPLRSEEGESWAFKSICTTQEWGKALCGRSQCTDAQFPWRSISWGTQGQGTLGKAHQGIAFIFSFLGELFFPKIISQSPAESALPCSLLTPGEAPLADVSPHLDYSRFREGWTAVGSCWSLFIYKKGASTQPF